MAPRRRGRGRGRGNRCAGTPLVVESTKEKRSRWSRGRKRQGGWVAGWLVGLTPGVESKTRENKNTYPAIGATSFRTFYSSQLDLFMRPAAASVVGWGRKRRRRRRLKCRAAGKAVSLLFHPHHALSVSGTGRFYCIFNSTLFIHVPFQGFGGSKPPARYFNGAGNVTRGWKWLGIFVEKNFIATTRIPTTSIWIAFVIS